MNNTMIDVLIVEAGIKPCKVSIDSSYENLKYLVNPCLELLSAIEFIILEDDVALCHNKEGVLLGLKGNRQVGGLIIAGTFFIVGIKNGKIVSLTKEKQIKYCKRFEKIEKYTDEDVSTAYWQYWLSNIK